MAEQGAQERTEQATPKKLEKARGEGQVSKSTELNSVAVLFAAVLAIWAFGETSMEQLGDLMRLVWVRAPEIDVVEIATRKGAIAGFGFLGLVAGPYMVVLLLAGLGVNIAQVGFVVSGKSIQPKLDKLNPIKGFGRFVNKRAMMDLFKSLAKIGLMGGIGVWTVRGFLGYAPSLANSDLHHLLTLTSELIGTLVIRILVALVILAILDFAFQRHQLAQDLKMTRQEIKDEMKETEGDPHLKSRIRRIQQEMSRRRMMKAVPDADVVVTNPTHYAVALKYDAPNCPAPIVVAKGVDLLALRIREIAEEAGVPIVEDQATARALYSTAEVGESIPRDLYGTVAEILALVYRRQKAARS